MLYSVYNFQVSFFFATELVSLTFTASSNPCFLRHFYLPLCGTKSKVGIDTKQDGFMPHLKQVQWVLHLNKLWTPYLYLASPKTDNGKQCRPRSDAAERGV